MSAKRFAVIGNPIAHSLSPLIHQTFAHAEKIDLTYERIEAPVDSYGVAFSEVAQRFFLNGGVGLNVTAPFKPFALSKAATASQVAQNAEAANTLTAENAGAWRADNTDGVGLARDLLRYLGNLTGCRILIHGAGGATAGVLHDLLLLGANISLYNRTQEKAEKLAQMFEREGAISVLPALNRETLQTPFDCVIHATSVRALPEGETLWDTALYSDHTFYYDIVYAKEDTAFLRWVKSHGHARVVNGLGMLVEQAAESFRIWHGTLPNTEPIRQLLSATQQ